MSRLGPKLTAPGFAWPDWMIAAELAAALGADLGVRSVNDLADELERHRAGLRRPDPGGPALRRRARRHRRAARPAATTTATRRARSTPWPCPGVESVERQGAPPRCRHRRQGPRARRAPPPWEPAAPAGRDRYRRRRAAARPQADSYTLRLVAGRRLYDAGSSVTGSPSLTPLVPALVARANPYDLDRLGASTGDRVRVRSARGELILPAESDAGVPRGVVAIDFNVPGGESAAGNAVATLIDSRQLGDRRAAGVGVIGALLAAARRPRSRRTWSRPCSRTAPTAATATRSSSTASTGRSG